MKTRNEQIEICAKNDKLLPIGTNINMAHGSSRINICKNCSHYTQVSRFSEDPKCPKCGKITQQTNETEIRKQYNLGYLYKFILNFGHWQIIKK